LPRAGGPIGNSPDRQVGAFGCIAAPLGPEGRHPLDPEVSLFVGNAVLFQEGHEFFRKALFLMMLLLVVNVRLHSFLHRLADRNGEQLGTLLVLNAANGRSQTK
jgi:hypothetical protein